MAFASWPSEFDCAVEVGDAGDAGGGIDKSGRLEVHLIHTYLGVDRRMGGIVGVIGPALPAVSCFPRPELRRHLERERRGEGEVGDLGIYLIVHAGLCFRPGVRYGETPVVDVELCNRQIWIATSPFAEDP